MTGSRYLLASGLALLVLTLACMGASAQMSTQRQGPHPEPAFRLTFEDVGGRLSLVKVQELTMVIPLTVKERIVQEGRSAKGYAVELLDENQVMLLNMGIEDPRITVSEYQDPDQPDRIRRETAVHDRMTFSVLVPAPEAARFVRMTRPAQGERSEQIEEQRREEIGTFDLKAPRPESRDPR